MLFEKYKKMATLLGINKVNCICNSVLEWVFQENLPAGKVVQINLPENLSKNLATRQVYVLRTVDDFYCILLKRTVGWKENFTGLLCCSSPLRSDYIVNSDLDRPYISINGFFPFEELFLRRDYGNGNYDVYFDLN